MILLGLAALGIDIGRMYVIKSELQAFADAAALNAAIRLDGTDQGIASAREAAGELAAGPNAMKWDMGTRPITEIATAFAKDSKTWEAAPKCASEYHFVRVTVSAPARLIFLKAFQPADSSLVAAASIAAKTEQTARLVQ